MYVYGSLWSNLNLGLTKKRTKEENAIMLTNFTSPEYAIETQNLCKSFNRTSFKLENISVKVPAGSFCALLGENGTGKSTLMKLLLGLIKPTSGEIKIWGKDIRQESLEIRYLVGYVAQSLQFDPTFTPKQTLQFTAGFWHHSVDAQKIEKRLIEVGLEAVINQPIAEFAGGQMRRLGIAQALVHNPQLLLVDELASLDPNGQKEIPALLKREQATKKQMTILMAVHSLEVVKSYCDYIILLKKPISPEYVSGNTTSQLEIIAGEKAKCFAEVQDYFDQIMNQNERRHEGKI